MTACRVIYSHLWVCLVLLSIVNEARGLEATSVIYSWSGYVEPDDTTSNPWGLAGDSAAITTADGTPYTLDVEVFFSTMDGSIYPGNVNVAHYVPDKVNFFVGGEEAEVEIFESLPLIFRDDWFSGQYDWILYTTYANLFGARLLISWDIRLPPDTFELSDTVAVDELPVFVNAPVVVVGGASTSDLLTIPDPTVLVSAKAIPEPTGLTLATLALIPVAMRRRRL